MEHLLYETKPYLLMGVGGLNMISATSTVVVVCAFTLGVLGGVILGMRRVYRR